MIKSNDRVENCLIICAGCYHYNMGFNIPIHNFSINLSDTKSQFHAKGEYTMDCFFISNPKNVQQYIYIYLMPKASRGSNTWDCSH